MDEGLFLGSTRHGVWALKVSLAGFGLTAIFQVIVVAISGIAEGERVVTVGGYQVRRLASLSTSVPVGHGHEH